FFVNYWYVFLLFFVSVFVWVKLYKLVTIKSKTYTNKKVYYTTSVLFFLIAGVLSLGGIRGGYGKATRPINIVDASNKVDNIAHANVVLNTPFCIVRTMSKKSFKKVHFVSEEVINEKTKPFKQYHSEDNEMQ